MWGVIYGLRDGGLLTQHGYYIGQSDQCVYVREGGIGHIEIYNGSYSGGWHDNYTSGVISNRHGEIPFNNVVIPGDEIPVKGVVVVEEELNIC